MTGRRALAAVAVLSCLALAGCSVNETPFAVDAGTPGGGLSCTPNLDGMIEGREFSFRAGSQIQYLVSSAGSPRAVDLAGVDDGAGGRRWDWSWDDPSDAKALLAVESIDDRWYADRFPEGSVAIAIEPGGAVEGIYSTDDEALWLYGFASQQSDPPSGRTLVVYDQRVALYRFPLSLGGRWTSSAAVVGGLVDGGVYNGLDTYEGSVELAGRLTLPHLAFTSVLQVRIAATNAPAVGLPSTTRRVLYLFECLGEVARATSLPDEPDPAFAVAAQVRRLSL